MTVAILSSYCKRLSNLFMDPTWRIQDITAIQVTQLISQKTTHVHLGSSGRKGGALSLKVT